MCWFTNKTSEKNSLAVPAQTAEAFLVIQQRQKAGSL